MSHSFFVCSHILSFFVIISLFHCLPMPTTACLSVSLSSPPSVCLFHPDIAVMVDWALKDNFHSILSVCLFVCPYLPLFIPAVPTGTYPQSQELTLPSKPRTYPTPKASNLPHSRSQERTLHPKPATYPQSWQVTPKAMNLLENQDLTLQTGNLLPKPATYPQSQQLTSEATNLPQRQDLTRKASNLPSKPGTYPQSQELTPQTRNLPQSQELTPKITKPGPYPIATKPGTYPQNQEPTQKPGTYPQNQEPTPKPGSYP